MAERVVRTRPQLHGSVEGLRQPPAPAPLTPDQLDVARAVRERELGEQATYRPIANGGEHVWVTTPEGRHPGLLVEWRKPEARAWHGRVVHTRLVRGEWVRVEEWLPASQLESAEDATPTT